MSARLTVEDHRLRSISEAQWRASVLDLAKRCGWRTYVAPNAGVRAKGTVQHVVAGWPDVTLVRGHRLLFAELKRQTGKTTPAQDEWLAALAAAGAEVHIFRPSDLDEVRRILGRDS